MARYLLGIDNGCTMIKATIFDENGTELGTVSDLSDTVSPHPHWFERDMDALWQANARAIRGALAQSGISPSDIAGVSITGHGNGAHLVDASGRPVRNAIVSTDSRALSYIKRYEDAGYYDQIHPRTMQLLWPAISLLMMAWMKDNEPENYHNTKWLFSVTDYIRFCLTGEAYSELSNASSTALVNNLTSSIDVEMLTELGLPEMASKMPPLLASFAHAGNITIEAAALTGLVVGTPVYGGCFDVDAAALATGTIDTSRITVISGSWANNQYIGKPPVVSRDFFSTTAFARPDYWLMLEGSPTSASNLEWFVGEFLSEEKRIAKAQGTSIYQICNQAVSETTPEESDIVFLPFLFGSNVNPNAKGCFVGIEGWHERKHIIRAIYEGICFSHRFHIEKLLRHLPAPEAARMSGGGAKSAPWSQMFADVLQMPMEIPTVTELGNLGAAMCAGIGVGLFSCVEDAATRIVNVSRTVPPDPTKKSIYDKKYQRYLALIQALDGYWEQ